METQILSDRTGNESLAEEMAGLVLERMPERRILLLQGDLGSGKTTFCKALLKKAGYRGEVSSPTFNIVNEYRLPQGQIVYHFDLYRISAAEELEEMGFAEYLDSGSLCVIEWPDMAAAYFDMPMLILRIFHSDNERRYVLEETV